jgi:hypothetical protein
MMIRALAYVGVCVLAFVACGGGDDDNGGGSGESIAALCARACQTTSSLACADASCASECESEANAIPACSSQYQAWLRCSADRPVSDFECDLGDVTLKDGVCSNEEQQLFACFMENLGGGGGDVDAG